MILNPAMLKVVKAQKRALNRFILLNLSVIALLVFYLVSTKLEPNVPPTFQALLPYAAIIIIALIFNGFFTFSILKKSNYNQVLSQFNADQLTQIDGQCKGKIKLFKQPIIYTNDVIFVFQGFVLRAIPMNNVIWLRHQTSTGFIEIVSRDKQLTKAMSQFFPADFSLLVTRIQEYRPNIFVTNNLMSEEGLELTRLFEQDFQTMVERAENSPLQEKNPTEEK